MSQSLGGRRFIITGAASGIGRATAALFTKEGAQVGLLDIDGAALESHAAQIGGFAVETDIAQEESVENAVAKLAEKLGGIDGIVNCAGIVASAALADSTLEMWHRILGVNLIGTFLVSREALPWLRQSTDATIVNVSSNQALKADAKLSAYAASKAGVIAMTRSLAAELGPNIRVNCVCPGTIETPMTAAVLPLGPITNCVMGRMGTVEEIAQVIRFLSSSEASFVTGSTLAADGGRTFH